MDPKLTFWCVSNYLGASGTVWLPYKTRCKMGRKVQKFVPQSRVRIFCNKPTRSTPLDPKLMVWCVSYNLGAFGAVLLPYKTQCKMGRRSAKVRASMSRRNFSQRTHPIHPIGPKTDVLEHFLLFGFIRDSLVALRNSMQNGPNKCKSSCDEVASDFFATEAPDPPHVTLN